MKIGIFGGSFDPVHNGHLVLAEHVMDAAGLDKIIFLPAYVSPFKVGKNSASPEDRLKMVRAAAEDNPKFEVSTLDMDKGEVSYTVDLMRNLSAMMPEDRLYFINGTDSFLGIEKWKDSEELLTGYGFVIGTRPGYRDEELSELADDLSSRYSADIQVINIPKVDISSTDIRHRIKSGRSVRYLVPERVEKYIYEHGLYR